jgi:hypothetical protein
LKEIVFTNFYGANSLYSPTPASQDIPTWYKDMSSYENNKKGLTAEGYANATAKKCMPIFDAINSGYLLYSYTDVFVSQVKDENGKDRPFFNWPAGTPITFHAPWQLPTHPYNTGHDAYPKWSNSWSIKTPKGYSCLFVAPLHRESIFTIFPGVVDTDNYISPINFPFVLNDINFTGIIPAGTPIAQVIPFKRDSWSMLVDNTKENIEQIIETDKAIATRFFDKYKTFFRVKKEYK